MIKLYKIQIDKHTILPIEEEYRNEFDEMVYTVFQDTIISLPNRDIKIPKNTMTTQKKAEEIVYWYLMKHRTILPHEASLIYYQTMKKLNIPFRVRFFKFLKSLLNVF